MSGNPFRASLSTQNTPTAAPPTSFQLADSSNRTAEDDDGREYDSVLDDASRALPAKTKKSVRISSPTETIPPPPAFSDVDDELSPVFDRGRRSGSPQPETPAAFVDDSGDRNTYDTTGKDVDERGMIGNTRKSTGASGSVLSPSGAPPNPFSRTLATIESQEKGGETAEQSRERTATDKPLPGVKRQSLNVEGFKNLLMQGITSPRSSGPPPQSVPASNPLSPPIFESSSSTDTSSISRQSIFDPAIEPHPESPRTSYDMAASDDEQTSLMGAEVPRKEKKKPPPAPKHRHGKLVSSRTPQTVSFSDFSATEATPSPPSHKRTNSDLNKPLPPTPPSITSPPAHIISQDSTHDTASISDSRDSEVASISEGTPTPGQKKAPPPVPIARRQSQLRSSTRGNRSRSNSSLTMSSQHSIEPPSISHAQDPTSNPTASQKAPPPPPPSRRHGAALSTITTSSANSSSTDLPTHRPSISSPTQTPTSNHPSSARRPTLSSEPPSPNPVPAGLTRTSSMHSARNVPRSRAVSNESSTMPPPPPPPRRRRESGRESLELQRENPSPVASRQVSGEMKRSSIEGRRPGSISSLGRGDELAVYSPREEDEDGEGQREREGEKEDREDKSNILDDMEKFQREIDELRERYEQAA